MLTELTEEKVMPSGFSSMRQIYMWMGKNIREKGGTKGEHLLLTNSFPRRA